MPLAVGSHESDVQVQPRRAPLWGRAVWMLVPCRVIQVLITGNKRAFQKQKRPLAEDPPASLRLSARRRATGPVARRGDVSVVPPQTMKVASALRLGLGGY
jgi:hypothetical protein